MSILPEHSKRSRKTRRKKPKTSVLGASTVSSPYDSGTRPGKEEVINFNLTDQDRLLKKLMKKSFRDDHSSTVNYKREGSLED